MLLACLMQIKRFFEKLKIENRTLGCLVWNLYVKTSFQINCVEIHEIYVVLDTAPNVLVLPRKLDWYHVLSNLSARDGRLMLLGTYSQMRKNFMGHWLVFLEVDFFSSVVFNLLRIWQEYLLVQLYMVFSRFADFSKTAVTVLYSQDRDVLPMS